MEKTYRFKSETKAWCFAHRQIEEGWSIVDYGFDPSNEDYPYVVVVGY